MCIRDSFKTLGLTNYQTRVLITLIKHGEAKASDVSELSGVPRSKVYMVLDQLVDLGFVDKIPGRPLRYKAKPPEEILDRLKYNVLVEHTNKLKLIDESRHKILRELKNLYKPIEVKPRELVRVVSVGEPSERETRIMYNEAKREINIISRSFEYYPKVRSELISARERGVKIKILLLNERFLDRRSKKIQKKIVETIKNELTAEIKFSKTHLPLRGTIVDPSYEYKTGKAIFVVEDPRTPLYLRDAAITENPSLVAGMKKYFDLIWKYESE